MKEPIIQVKGISKRYVLKEKTPYNTLRDVIVSKTKKRNEKSVGFWALRNISFEVGKGEVVGVIGQNGAGKTTLLKVLSRITPPTKGRAILKGRVGSLLGVGTGFHSELTGRENMFLNGVILGMKKWEIQDKFDEIVEFSGVRKFLDTPVKHYSSGMRTRLAFSVAAFLEPEILLVDEVLSVGDVEFQKRSLGKMESVAKKEGRTILFVSHNMAAVENLCRKTILLEAGKIVSFGPTNRVIKDYMTRTIKKTKVNLENRTDRKGTGEAIFTSFHIENEEMEKVSFVKSGQNIYFVFEIVKKKNKKIKNVQVSFAIVDHLGRSLILHRTNFTNQTIRNLSERVEVRCKLSAIPLAKGNYHIGIFLEGDVEVLDDPGMVYSLRVESGDFFGTGSSGMTKHSPILVKGDWSYKKVR